MNQFANNPKVSKSDEDLPRLVEMAPLPAFVIDGDCNFIVISSAAINFLGYTHEELSTVKLTNIVRSQDSWSLPDAVHRFLTGPDNKTEWEFLRRDREWQWCEVISTALSDDRYLIFVNDISARRRAEASFPLTEERRWQTQKIEALERLAGGIAHDFNNLLAVILLQTEMMNLQLAPSHPAIRRVEEIKAVANDAAGIIRQLLAFGRKQPMSPVPVVLNQVIEKFGRDLSSHLGKQIRPVLILDPYLGICLVDPNQIAQALLFLSVNAKDAMPNGGILTIETANIVVDQNISHKSQPGGRYVQITVSDNGVGMDARTEDHIFEPFFSTKESDKGAGLSLAAVYGIVKQLGGFIWVESQIGLGTRFKIQFPRIDEPVVDVLPVKTGELTARGNETILLVDDDRSVRRIAAEILRVSGYEVLEATSGMEALEIAQGYPGPIDLLLTDYSMPQMNGGVTADGVRKLHPETVVIFMSGSTGHLLPNADESDESIKFLAKPFSSSSLTLKIREVLRSKSDSLA